MHAYTIHIHMQIHIHIHACKHTYIHTYVELYVHANDPHQCTHEHKRRHTHINMHPHIYIYPMPAHVYAEPTIWLNMRTYTHMPTCTPHVPIDQRVHARARINIYIYTHLNIHVYTNDFFTFIEQICAQPYSTYRYTYTCVHTDVYKYRHERICTYIRQYVATYIQFTHMPPIQTYEHTYKYAYT
jgi:hypothetical protein